MANRTYEKAVALVCDHVRKDWDEETSHLVAMARTDLWFGPNAHDEDKTYPGWVAASEQIRSLMSDLPSELWVDTQAEEVVDSEPDADEDPETGEVFEPCWEDYIRFDRLDIARAVLGRDLVGNL